MSKEIEVDFAFQMQNCLKLDTDNTDIIWLFWKERMVDPAEWTLILDTKHRCCYECSTIISNPWSNRFSYEIIMDKVVYNYYCEPCYNKWIGHTISNKIVIDNTSIDNIITESTVLE